MRNKDLDKVLPEDSKIGELQTDEHGRPYRMVNGRKIGQIEERTPHDVELQKTMNRVRASGMSIWDYLKR